MNKFFHLKTFFEEDPEAGGGGGSEWVQGFENEALKTTLGQYESQEAFFKEIGYEPPKPEEKDWREGLDEDLRKTADRFNSPADAMRAIQDFRKRDSQIRIPGKDASDEEKAKYLSAIGVPESPDKYEWPTIPEDQMTDELKVSRETWGKRFHELNVPNETAKLLSQFLNDDLAEAMKAQNEADKAFAEEQENVLKNEWKGEFDKNKTLANRALENIAQKAGVDVESLMKLEMKDGRFLLDNANMLRLFANIGREMDEGSLGPALTDSEAETINERIENIRKDITQAQSEGNTKKANKLFQEEQALLAKLKGNQPVVGAAGRSV